MNAQYLKNLEALKPTKLPLDDGAPLMEALKVGWDTIKILAITAMVLFCCALVVVACVNTVDAGKAAYEKSPTLQNTINTPVKIFNELNK